MLNKKALAWVLQGLMTFFVIMSNVELSSSTQLADLPVRRRDVSTLAEPSPIELSITLPGRVVIRDNGSQVPVPVNVTVSRKAIVRENRPVQIDFELLNSARTSWLKVDGLPMTIVEGGNGTVDLDTGATATNDSRFQFSLRLSSRIQGIGLITARAYTILDDNSIVNLTVKQGNGSSSTSPLLAVRSPITQIGRVSLYLLAIGMAVNILSFSCRLHMAVVRHILRHPSSILIGIGCQFVVMPVVSFLLGLAFGLTATMRYALLALGCSPGGGPSNFITLMLRGDLNMSVIMTFVSNLFSVGMMPLWVCTLGAKILQADFPDHVVKPPWLLLLLLALLFSVPTLIGMIFARTLPEKISLIVAFGFRGIGIAMALVGFAGALYSNLWVFDYIDKDWRVIVATTLFCHIGYLTSLLLARFIGRRSSQVTVTVAIEAGVQSTPAMLFLLQTTAPQPEGMIAYVVAVVYVLNLIGIVLLTLLAVIGHRILLRCRGEADFGPVEQAKDATPMTTFQYRVSVKQNSVENSEKNGNGGVSVKGSALPNTSSSSSLKSLPYDANVDRFGMRNGSFVQLTEKY